MNKTWKIAVLFGILPTLAWANASSPAAQPPAAHAAAAQGNTGPDAVESPDDAPFDGHYVRAGKNEAALDILQVGPGVLRIKGFAQWVGDPETGNVNTGEVSGTVHPQRLKAHFENQTGCKLDILFQADGLKVENTATACGGLNVTFNGEYTRTGPPELGRKPGGR